MSALDSRWRALAVNPIVGAEPFGSDPQYDPSFEEVESQIHRLQTNPAALDWGRVVAAAVRVLETRAKDWRMACRLTAALYHTQGYPGLALGLGVLRDLMDESRWLQIFPPPRRLRSRAADLDWLSERLVAALEQAPEPSAAAAPSLAEAVATLEEIDARLGAAFGEQAPILSSLRASLGRACATALARESEQVAAAAPPSANPAAPGPPQPAVDRDQAADRSPAPAPPLAVVATAAAQPAASPAAAPVTPERDASLTATPMPPIPPITVGADPARALREIKSGLVTVAATLRSHRLADPRPYVLLRSALWMDLERLPPATDGVTEVPEPTLERRLLFEQLGQQGEWGQLIEEVEETLGRGSLFWLDAHRLVANALEALGPGHGEARQAVVQSLAFLLRRFPGLERLKFKQGSGFADALTLAWIAAEVLPPTAGEVPAAAEASPWAQAATAAGALAVKGRVAEGLALFSLGIARAGSLRERFCWELAQARACVAAGLHAVARSQLECLESTVEQFQLELWEPGLALEVAQLYLATERQTGGDGRQAQARPELQRRLLGRLCRYDVAAALTLNAH